MHQLWPNPRHVVLNVFIKFIMEKIGKNLSIKTILAERREGIYVSIPLKKVWGAQRRYYI